MVIQTRFLKRFMERQESGGIALLLATLAALFWANAFASGVYEHFWESWAGLDLGDMRLGLPLKEIVNDVLMALFFLMVGCELKRERVEGELSTPSQIRLPFLAALGGMLMPALIYGGLNVLMGGVHPETMRGWAIPTATDIAFALGVFVLLGSRVPTALKTFLLALAIIDDLGAVVLIGLFYSSNLCLTALVGAGAAMAGLWFLNKRGVGHFLPYGILGVALWFAVFKSGIHATLAGVLLAFFLPLRNDKVSKESGEEVKESLLKRVEQALHPWVAFLILPIFALANAGVSLEGVTREMLFSPVTLGIALGLFFGKQAGVFGATWIACKTGLASLPKGASWSQIYGTSILCGIGFTMSLFIGLLAFEDPALGTETRLGILSGSTLAAMIGYFVLARASAKKAG